MLTGSSIQYSIETYIKDLSHLSPHSVTLIDDDRRDCDENECHHNEDADD